VTGRVWFDDRRDHWVCVLELGRKPDGSRWTETKSFKGKTGKKDAETYKRQRLHEMDEGSFVATNTITVAEWSQRWLRDYAPLRTRDTTLDQYTKTVNNHIIPDLGHIRLQKLDKPTVQAVITKWSQVLAASTTRQVTSVLKAIIKEAVESGVLKRDPTSSVVLPKVQRKEMRALDESETAALLDSLRGDKLYLPVLIAVSTGMRRGEILGMKWDAITGNVLRITQIIAQNGAVHPPKTERGWRSITLPSTVLAALRERKREQKEERVAMGAAWKDTGYVLTRKDGNHWTVNDLSCNFTRQMQRLKMQLRFHDLRHTHASQLLRAGFPLNAVAERLGHDPGETLRTYSHIMPGQDAQIAAQVDAMLASMDPRCLPEDCGPHLAIVKDSDIEPDSASAQR
jgi:integrase